MVGFLSSLKVRFWIPLPEWVKNVIKLALVVLAWVITTNQGLSILPLSVALFFFHRLAGGWKTWVVLVVTGALIGVYNSTGFGQSSWDHWSLDTALYATPAIIFLRRLLGGIRRRRTP